MRRCETVHDPELGTIKQVTDESGEVVATSTMSPVHSDGSFVVWDEVQVFKTGFGLMPLPSDFWDGPPTAFDDLRP